MPPAAANAGPKDQQESEFGPKQRDAAIRDAVENVFARAMSEVTCRESMQHVTREAIQQCLECCHTVVDMAFPQRESQPISDIALKNRSWEPDPEPVPCAVDTWIRSAIPEVEKPVAARDVATSKTSAHHDGAPSTRRSGIVQGLNDVVIKSPDRTARNTASVSGSPTGARASTSAERHAEERLREELDARKAQAAVVQRMKQKDEEARAKLATLQKDLRGKDYAYNHKGEVVVLSKLDPDKMPASVAPDLRVATPPPPPDQQGSQRASPAPPSRPSPKSPTKAKASAHRAGAAKPYSDAEYKELPSRSQPNAMDTMKLTGGVMLRQGDKLRKGPARPAPPSSEQQMTRNEFQQYARATERRDTIATEHSAPRVSNAGAAPARAHLGSSPAAASGQLPALRVSLGVDPPSSSATASPQPSTRQAPPSKPAPLDVNLALTSSPDWGSSTGGGLKGFSPPQGVLPKARPGVKERSMEVGAGRFPRARVAHTTMADSLKAASSAPGSDKYM